MTASSAESDDLCAGRYWAQRGLPESPTDASEAGDRVHNWLHWVRTGGMSFPPPLEGDAEIELAQRCWDIELKEKAEWLERMGVDASEVHIHSEERLFSGNPLYPYSGQPDVVYHIPWKGAAIFDAKSGRLPVPPSNRNKQLRALAALYRFSTATASQNISVAVQIIQPFAKREPQCIYEEDDLHKAWSEIKQRVDRSMHPNAPRTPGEVQCRWCKAKGSARCPETQQAVISLSKMEVATIPSPQLVEACLLAEPIIELVKQRAREALIANPDAIPGFSLKENSPNEPITATEEAWSRAYEFGLPRNDFLECAKLTKGDLEAKLKALYRRKTQRDRIPVKEWDEKWQAFLDGITTSQPKQPTLVRTK